jgi:hypothetical protein
LPSNIWLVTNTRFWLVQTPPMQIWLAVHTFVQLPQCWGSVVPTASQPFEGLPSQSRNPGVHVAIWQEPPRHWPLAFGNEHDWPHAPQFCVVSSDVQITLPPPEQQSLFVGHTVPQAPQLLRVVSGVHVPLQQPLLKAQVIPQPPQLALSLAIEVHVPLQQRLPAAH